MTEFETIADECLEALTTGRWDLDECLRRYPEHAGELRPLLAAAIATSRAFDVEPRPEFAAAARERFLIATGQRLQESLDAEPTPTFFAAARIRFLLAAQRMKPREAAGRQPRRIPLFGTPFRALASGMAAVVILLGASTYTVASADAAIPGDWQYPIKLQTERVRLALAFTEDDKRGVKLDIAEERVNEIQELSRRGRIIGPGVLDRLVEQTEPLVNDVKSGGWDTSDAARLQEIARKQHQVLVDASAQAQVAPDAMPQLVKAEEVSQTGVEAATLLIFNDPNRAPVVVTPSHAITSTPQSTMPAIIVPATPTPEGSTATAEPDATPPTETPSATDVPAGTIVVGATPAAEHNNVKYYELRVDRVRLLVPGGESGWYLDNTQDAASPNLLRYAKVDGSAFMVISKISGDLYWFVQHNGTYDQVQMRVTNNGQVSIADGDIVRVAYGDQADIPLFVRDSIELAPEPTPTPEPTQTPSTTPTSTPTAHR